MLNMVKVHKMFCIDWEIAKLLEDVNGSELANSLLKQHFEMGKITKAKDNEKIIEDVKKKMSQEEQDRIEEDERKKSFAFMEQNRQEFNEGYKAGKWKNHQEFYKERHK